MKSVTAAEASKQFGRLLKLAEEGPVEITRHGGRARYVIMSAQLFQALDLIRQAHSEDRLLFSLESAAGKLLEGEDEKGVKLLRLGNAMMRRFLDATGEGL